MSVRVVVVYHSEGGRTRALAEAACRGAASVEDVEASAIDVSTARVSLEELARADAIIFGAPTYMGSASSAFKAFMDATAPVWALQGWRDKLAAGFTHSAAPSGDKLGTLTQLAVFAAQHGMVWVGLGLPPSYATASEPRSAESINRLGSHLGAMAQSSPGSGSGPAPGDLRTCEHLGRRVAEHAARWARGRIEASPVQMQREAAASTWRFPPVDRPSLLGACRTNLRELAARPGRFEHHLLVVARAAGAQLELATASEPLCFAHVNLSDEYAVALPTGDDTTDGFPMRTFLADARSGQDLARYNHRVGDLLLHPLGPMHWPGRLRPPFEPFAFPRTMRRCGLSLVFCASSSTPGGAGPAGTSSGREADAKAYVSPAPPMMLRDVMHDPPGTVARVGDATLELVVQPRALTAPQGAYVVVLEARDGSPHHACDLIHLDVGASLDGRGIDRALVFAGTASEAGAPPDSWDRVPTAPMVCFEDRPHGSLPLSCAGVVVEEVDAARVSITVGASSAIVPRHWLARMLFRVALHRPALGYVETYGGFFYDDRAGREGVGLRGGGEIVLGAREMGELLETIYRAVAPPGYTERPQD